MRFSRRLLFQWRRRQKRSAAIGGTSLVLDQRPRIVIQDKHSGRAHRMYDSGGDFCHLPRLLGTGTAVSIQNPALRAGASAIMRPSRFKEKSPRSHREHGGGKANSIFCFAKSKEESELNSYVNPTSSLLFSVLSRLRGEPYFK